MFQIPAVIGMKGIYENGADLMTILVNSIILALILIIGKRFG
jgi:hypothetical protein